MKMMFFLKLSVILLLQICFCIGQLVVNVRNSGGDLLKESINANTTQDTVTLEFNTADDTHVALFIDMKNEVQITKVTVMGELELGQDGYQVMCFVTRFLKNEFISSDAMSKLRQKNPGAIRHPEDDKGTEFISFDLSLRLEHTYVISPYIKTICHQARDATYVKDADLKALSRALNKDYSAMTSATNSLIPTEEISQCADIHTRWQTCVCRYHTCIGWYPCGLKYCRGKDSAGKVVSYRCGIKTCSVCRRFEYVVQQKQACIWYEHPLNVPMYNGTIWGISDAKTDAKADVKSDKNVL